MFPNILRSNFNRASMHDYGNFVPGALKSSSDKALLKLGTEMNLFEDLTTEIPPVLASTHALINGESYTVFKQHISNVSQETYIMKEVVSTQFINSSLHGV